MTLAQPAALLTERDGAVMVYDGWGHSADLATADPEGNLWYQGHDHDVIISVGYPIVR